MHIPFKTAVAVAVGTLSRDELEDLAANLSLTGDGCASGDALRAAVTEAYAQQGAPHLMVAFDPAYVGGEYSGHPSQAFIPLALIDAVSTVADPDDVVEMAFRRHVKLDSVHIVRYSWRDITTAQGQPYVRLDILDPDRRWSASAINSEAAGLGSAEPRSDTGDHSCRATTCKVTLCTC